VLAENGSRDRTLDIAGLAKSSLAATAFARWPEFHFGE